MKKNIHTKELKLGLHNTKDSDLDGSNTLSNDRRKHQPENPLFCNKHKTIVNFPVKFTLILNFIFWK